MERNGRCVSSRAAVNCDASAVGRQAPPHRRTEGVEGPFASPPLAPIRRYARSSGPAGRRRGPRRDRRPPGPSAARGRRRPFAPRARGGARVRRVASTPAGVFWMQQQLQGRMGAPGRQGPGHRHAVLVAAAPPPRATRAAAPASGSISSPAACPQVSCSAASRPFQRAPRSELGVAVEQAAVDGDRLAQPSLRRAQLGHGLGLEELVSAGEAHPSSSRVRATSRPICAISSSTVSKRRSSRSRVASSSRTRAPYRSAPG